MRGKRLSRDAALRFGAIGLAVAAAALVLPGLLSPPEPPPLPADVGLGATGATGAAGIAAANPRRDRPRGQEGEPKDSNRKPDPEEAREEGPERGVDRESRERPRPERGDVPPPPPPPAPAPAPAPAPPPTYAAPAPAPIAPAPAPAAPGEFGP